MSENLFMIINVLNSFMMDTSYEEYANNKCSFCNKKMSKAKLATIAKVVVYVYNQRSYFFLTEEYKINWELTTDVRISENQCFY